MSKLKTGLLSACVFAAVTASSAAFADVTTTTVPSTSAAAPAPLGATQGPTLHSQSGVPADTSPSPYQIKLQYTGEAWDNEGGLHSGTAYMNQADAQLRVDAGKAFGWTGGRFLVDGFYESSRSLDAQYVGAIQDPSVIDTSGQTMFRLYQAYYDQALGNTDLLIGKYDLQTEFANTKPMGIFFSGAYAWNTALDQSGLNGASTYPNTSLAFRARQTLDDQWSVQGAVLDGQADSVKYPGVTSAEFGKNEGALFIGEVDYTPIARTKIMVGYWGYTSKFDTKDQTNADGTTHQVYGSDGGYIGGATRLYTLEGRRGLDGFFNLGVADPTVNEVDRTVNAGLNFTGLFDARPSDKIGIATSVAGVSDPYRKAQLAQGDAVEHYETNFEMTYRAPITSWLTVQPDIQYWIHPNVDPNMKNDLLVGVHFEIGHLFNM